MGQRIKRGTGSTINEVPEELINEILLNLAVKSLLRFKCVSKPWRALISSKLFTEEHLQKSKSSDFVHRKLICKLSAQNPPPPHPNLWSCSVKSLLDCDNLSRDRVPIGSWSEFTDIRGSCNGLILIGVDNSRDFRRRDYVGRGLLLWNPSTRQLNHIPPVSYRKPRYPLHSDRYLYGLGYDDSTDDYKIVCIFSSEKTYRTEIYSLRNDSWKRAEDFKMGTPIHSSGKLVKGKLHWLAYDDRKYTRPRDFIALGPRPKNLVALDLAKEEYEIVAGLRNFSYYDYWQRCVSNLGGNLGLVCVNSMRSDIHVWTMMKHGEAESWTKIWARSEYLSPERERIVSPLWFRENGDIAVRSGPSGTCIEVYNIRDKSRKSGVYEVDGNLVVLCFYVESLVSPFGDQDLGDEVELEQLQFVL